jgi:uncharacterized membrane protein YbhN (UPF0104 family)
MENRPFFFKARRVRIDMSLSTKFLRLLISSLLLGAFLVWLVWYVMGHTQEFVRIAKVPWLNLFALYVLFAAILSCNALYTKYILSAFGVTLRLKEWVSLAIGSAVGNYVSFFRGGAVIRALYLKAHYRFSFSDFLSTLSAVYLMYFIVNGAMGILGMLLLFRMGYTFDIPLATSFVGLASLSVIIMMSKIRLPEFEKFPLRQIARIINGWDLVRKNRRLFAQLMGITAFGAMLLTLQTKVAFSSYGVHLSWGAVMCFSAAKGLALLATITPGALGIVEWISVYLGQSLSYTASEALMAQALMRTVTITTLLITGPFAAHYMGWRSIGILNDEKLEATQSEPNR